LCVEGEKENSAGHEQIPREPTAEGRELKIPSHLDSQQAHAQNTRSRIIGVPFFSDFFCPAPTILIGLLFDGVQDTSTEFDFNQA